jgi:hypothetical protein
MQALCCRIQAIFVINHTLHKKLSFPTGNPNTGDHEVIILKITVFRQQTTAAFGL